MTSEDRPEVTLYYGDNGQHEFWETAGLRPGPGGLLLMNERGRGWRAEIRRIGLPLEWDADDSLEALIRRLADKLGWRICLNAGARWEEPSTLVYGIQRMTLQALDGESMWPYGWDGGIDA